MTVMSGKAVGFLNMLGPGAERRGTGRNNDVPHVIRKWIFLALAIALPVALMRPLTSTTAV